MGDLARSARARRAARAHLRIDFQVQPEQGGDEGPSLSPGEVSEEIDAVIEEITLLAEALKRGIESLFAACAKAGAADQSYFSFSGGDSRWQCR